MRVLEEDTEHMTGHKEGQICDCRGREREGGGREGEGDKGREGGKEGGREEQREREREGGTKREREGGREEQREREGGREGGIGERGYRVGGNMKRVRTIMHNSPNGKESELSMKPL